MPHVASRDGLGGRVPQYLRKVFEDRARFRRERLRMARGRRSAAWLAQRRGGAEFDFNTFLNASLAAEAILVAAEPFAVCDCSSEQPDCPKCKGKRWLSHKEYQAVLKRERT